MSDPKAALVPCLFPAFLPYSVQHLILTTTQRLLEECCFDFAAKWLPNVLEENGWDCAESVELTMWSKTLARLIHKLPAHSTHDEAGTPLNEILFSTSVLRHSAVHRLPTSSQGVQRMMKSALRLAAVLGDNPKAASIERLASELDSHVKIMQSNKTFLENRLDDQLRQIQEQRAELDSREVEAMAATTKEDKENGLLVGSLLEASLREIMMNLDQPWHSSFSDESASSDEKRAAKDTEDDKNNFEGQDSDDELENLGHCCLEMQGPEL